MKQGTITRSTSRTAQLSRSSRGTYVKPPRMRHSVFVVKQALRGLAAVTALQLATPAAFALPAGEAVQFGTVTFDRTTTPNTLNMTTSNKAGVNWTSFSIAAPETVNIAQPSSSSVMLNRVVGTDQSQIFGALNANGKVFLVNPNGILFAPGAAVNVGGLVASTLDITNDNFQNGIYQFNRVDGSAAGSVVNQANIAITVPGSYAALIGTNVSNEGTISVVSTTVAGRGAVALAAGDRVTLNIVGDNLINVSVDAAALGASVLNKNGAQILADGGSVFLTARSADALLGTVINNSGLIQATSLVALDGRIFLDGGTGGVANSGTLEIVGAGGSINSSGGAFSNTGSVAASGATVDINHTGTVTIESGVTAVTMTVTGGGIDITNSGAAGFAVNASGTQTFTATQNDINVTNSGTGQLSVNALAAGPATPGVQTFAATQGDINITSPGTGGIRVESFGGLGTPSSQTFDTKTGAGLATTGNMKVVGSGGDVRVSSNAGTQTIKLTGNLTVGDAAAQKSTELAFNSFQDVKAAAISVIGGAGNTAGATLHSFGGQKIVTGNLTLTGGTAPAFTVIPGFISSPSASILNNTTGTQDITATAINITGGTTGSGNSAGIGNFANSAQKITADSITLTGGAATNSNAFIQSGNSPTVVGTMEVHTGALTLAGQTSNATIGGGPGSSTDITVTGNTTLTGSDLGGSAVIGLLGTTNNATYTVKFTGTGDLSLQGGNGGLNPGSAHIGAGSNHTNPTVDIDVKAANITLTAGNNNGGAFIGNSNNQTTVGGGDISVAATAGNLVMNTSPDGTQRSAIRSIGGTHRSISLSAAGNIIATGGRLQSGGNLTTHTDGNTTFGLTTVGGNLLATATGSITNTQTVTVTGAGSLNMTSGGPIVINADVTTANGLITLDAATSLTNNATISNGGGANTANILLKANAYDLDGTGGTGQVQGGNAAVVLTPHTSTNSLGIVSGGDTTVAQSDLDAIHTTNFVALGSAIQGFTGNTTIGENALVDGGGKSLAFFRVGPGSTTIGAQGVTTTGDVIVSAGGGNIISHGGTVSGDHVQLRATTGIGANTPTGRVLTDANVLAINNIANGAFVTEANNISLNNVNLTVGGNINNVANSGGNGGYNFIANGAISIDGQITTNVGPNGVINITSNSITNHAAISNGGGASSSNIILAADALSLAGGTINSGSGATILRPRTPSKSMGIEAAGDVTLTNADIASITTSNFLIFGSGSGALGAFTGDMAIGVNNTVNGGGKNLSFLRDPTTVATTTIGGQGVTTTGNVIISAGAGNILSQGGTISGNQIELRAGTGIGTALNRVQTSANTLAVQNQSGGAFVTEANAVTLADVNQVAGGTPSNATNTGGTGAYDVVAGGTITVGTGGVNTTGTGSTRLETTIGNISIGNNNVGHLGSATTLVSAGNITGGGGVVSGSDVVLDSATGVGTALARINTAATTLAARSTVSGGVFVAEADAVTLATIGGVENSAAAGAAYNVRAGGTISVGTGGVNTVGTGSTALDAVNGSIAIGANDVGNLTGTTSVQATVDITGTTGTVRGTSMALTAQNGSIGADGAPLNTAATTLAASGNTGVFIHEADSVNLVVAQSNGPIAISNATGDMTVGIVSTTGPVTLTAQGGSIVDDGDNGTRITGGDVTLTAGAGSVGTLANDIDTAATTLTVNTAAANGNIVINQANSLTALNLNAGTGNVSLTLTAGSVTDTDNATDVVGSSIAITAPDGIGTQANPIQVDLGAGVLALTTTTGNIFADETLGDLSTSQLAILTGAGAQTVQIRNTSGKISVDNAFNATDDHLVLATTALGQNIEFATGGSLTSTASVTLNAAGAITDNAGDLTNNIIAPSASLAAGSGIGSTAEALEIDVTTLTQARVSGPGGINITDTAGGLAVNAASTANGGITLTAQGGLLSLAGDINAGGGATGTLSLSGNGVIQTAGNITATGAANVNGNGLVVSLPSAGNDFIGTLTVTGSDITVVDVTDLAASVVASGSANLTAGAALTVDGFTGLNLITQSGASTTFGTTQVLGSLSTNAGTDILQTGAVAVAGPSGLHAGGDIALTGANNFIGAVTASGHDVAISSNNLDVSITATTGNLNAASTLFVSGSTTGSLTTNSGNNTAFRATSVGGDLHATAGGFMVQTAPLTVAGTSTLEANQDVFLNNPANDFVGAVSAAGNNVTLVDANSMTASIISLNTTNLTALTGSLGVSGRALGGLTTSSATDTSFGATEVGGAGLTALAGGNITQTGVLSVFGPSALNATGNVALANPGNDFAGTVNAAGANISLADVNALVLSANTAGDLTTLSGGSTSFGLTNVGGDLSATAGTSITQTGALTVNGHASVSGGSITLGGGNAFNAGTLTFNSTGAVSIHENSDTVLSGTNTADSLSLTSSGSITDSPGIIMGVTNNASFSGSSITLGTGLGDGIDFGTLTFNSPGAVSIREASATVLSGTNTADSLSLTTTALGSITNAPLTSLNVTHNASLSADTITLGNNAGDSINFGSLTFNSAGAVSISEASATQIAGTNTADSLALSSTGAITDAAGTHLTVTHDASFTGTSITLADSATDRLEVGDNGSFKATTGGITIGDAGFVNLGSLTFNSPGAVVVQEDCCTLIAGINQAGSLNLTSAEGITNTDFAKINVTGNASFKGTSITLADHDTNVLSVGGNASFTATTGGVSVGTANVANFGTLTFNAPGAVSIREGSDTAITGSNTAGSLVLSSAGAITEVGTSLEVAGNANLSGTSINLGNNAGDTVNFGSLTFSSPGSVMISEDSATRLDGTSMAGTLTLTSTGPITQTGPLTVTGTSNISAGTNAITLTDAANNFVGLLTITGGTVKVTDANSLTVQIATGETYIISSGDLTIGGHSGNLTAVSNGGTVVWNNLTGANVILIAATPGGAANASSITGPSTTGNVLAPNVTYNNRGDARGTNLRANGELIIIARDIPGAPLDSSASAATAILDIAKLNPENRLQLILDNPNGKLRLLVDQGAFRFRAGSQFPGGVSVPDPKKTQVFVGNQKLDATPDAASSAISAAQQSALNSASSDARQSFGTDSVTQQIDMGFAGDVGIAPTMAHNVPLQGEIISTPEGVTESKGGEITGTQPKCNPDPKTGECK
jgi:filamentous hemagglutinin family protein